MPTFRIFLSLFALAIAALSFSFGRTELLALRHIQLPPFDQIQPLREPNASSLLPRSSRYRAGLLFPCIEDQRTLVALFYPQADRLALARTCSQMAATVLAQSPTDSLARLALANAMFVQNDIVQVNEALKRSQKTAPHEGSLAIYRVDLAFALGSGLSASNNENLNRDISSLLLGHRTRPIAARFYLENPDQKDRFLAIVEQHPPAIQRAFLASIQAELQ